MFDESAGLAVGDDGYFLRTANGGNRWETGRLQVTGVVVGRNENLQAVSIVDANFAVAAGFDGVVYKTSDRGMTWQSIGYPNLPGEYFISDVKFINHNFGYVVGSRPGNAQGLFRTTDGGATWTPVFPNGGQSIDFTDANHGWVVGVSGFGYRTTDGGATWQQMLLPNHGFTPTISKIDFINENVGWAVGWDGYAAHTTDGGRNWQLQNIASMQHVIIGLHVWSEMEAFAVGASSSGGAGSFYHTTDAGATWTKLSGDNALWGRGWYFEHIAVDPRNDSIVYTSGSAGIFTRRPTVVRSPASAACRARAGRCGCSWKRRAIASIATAWVS